MPMPVRSRLAGRYGQATLDPSRPLYVRRRISRGAAGALVPGEVFDAAGAAPHRLRMLYRNGHISHDPPKATPSVADVVAAALARAPQAELPPVDVEPPAVIAPLLEQPPAGKKQRARAGA